MTGIQPSFSPLFCRIPPTIIGTVSFSQVYATASANGAVSPEAPVRPRDSRLCERAQAKGDAVELGVVPASSAADVGAAGCRALWTSASSSSGGRGELLRWGTPSRRHRFRHRTRPLPVRDRIAAAARLRRSARTPVPLGPHSSGVLTPVFRTKLLAAPTSSAPLPAPERSPAIPSALPADTLVVREHRRRVRPSK